MSIEKHVIELSARDTLSPTLQKVGREAETAGRKAEAASKSAARSTQDWSRAASALGAGLGLATAAAIRFANEAEVRQRRLETAIQNTGHAYEEYADAIDQAADSALKLAFDDDDAIDALSQLTDASGDAQRAISDLAIAQDIARGRNISLAQATDIVIAAETGRIQSLKRMGIEIDASASKEEALAALQTKYAGQAEAYAKTNQATWDRVSNEIGNRLEQMGGYLADFQAPLLALGTAGAALGPLGDAFEAMGGKAKLAQMRTAALSSAWIGPAGLVAAAALAAVAVVKWSESLKETRVNAQDVTEQVENLTKAIAGLGKAGVDKETLGILADTAPLYAHLGEKISGYSTVLGSVIAQENELRLERSAGNNVSAERIREIDAELDRLESLRQSVAANVLTDQEYQQVQQDSIDLLTNLNSLNADVVTARYKELWQQFESGQISARELADGIQYLKDNVDVYGLTLEQIAKQQKDVNSITFFSTDAYKYWTREQKSSIPVMESSIDRIKAQRAALEDGTVALDENTKAWHANLDAAAARAQGGTYPGASDLESETAGVAAVKQEARDAAAATLDLADGFGLGNVRARLLADQTSTIADNIGLAAAQASDRLAGTFQIIVGNTNGILSTVDSVAKWGDELIGVEGTVGTIDDLLARGLITQRRYDMAQRAYNRILEDQKDIQDDVYTIQAKLAPVIADQVRAQERQLDVIRDMDTTSAAAALGWMDATEAQQNLTIATQLGAAANTEYGSTARQAMESYIQGIIATDPIQTAMLEKQELIFQDKDGNWHINWDNADQINSAMDDLTESLTNLVTALEYTYNIDINGDGVIGVNNNLQIAKERIEGLDDTVPVVTVDDSSVLTAHGDITAAHNALNGEGGLDGSIATALVNADASSYWSVINDLNGKTVATTYINVNPRVGPIPDFALGGMVPDGIDTAALGRVSGGRTTLVGEHGPELVNLPGGALVTPNHASRYMSGGRGGATYQFNGPITVVANNPQQFMQQMKTWSSTMGRP